MARPGKLWTAVAFVGVAILCACSSSSNGTSSQSSTGSVTGYSMAAAKQEGTVTLYTTLGSPQAFAEIESDFKKATGITLVISRQSGDTLQRWQADAARRNSPDVVELSDAGQIEGAIQGGLAAKFTPAAVVSGQIQPISLFAPYAYPTNFSAFGFAYNTNRVTPAQAKLLGSWSTSFNSAFKGSFGTDDPALVGGMASAMWIMKNALGPSAYTAMLNSLAVLKPRLYNSNVPMMAALASGDLSVVLGRSADISAELQKGAPIKFVYADPAPLSIGVIMVAKGAKHPQAARAFEDWYLSVQGQEDWCKAYATSPVNAKAPDCAMMAQESWYQTPTNTVQLTKVPSASDSAALLSQFKQIVGG